MKCPRVVVISYSMLRRLRMSILEQEWVTLIVDESHNLRCTKKSSERDEVLEFSHFVIEHSSSHEYVGSLDSKT